MRSQIIGIHQTQDPAKREELIQVHMAGMRDMMKVMQGGKMGGPQGAMMHMIERQQMMEQRQDMMMTHQSCSIGPHSMKLPVAMRGPMTRVSHYRRLSG